MDSQTVAQCQEPHSSVEVSTSTKGVATWTVKVYAHDPDQAHEEAVRIFGELEQRYGRRVEP